MTSYRQRLDQLKYSYEGAKTMVEQEQKTVKEVQVKLSNLQEASEVVQTVAQAVEQAVHDRIASVVTDCLEAVFDDPYVFRIDFERKRNRTEAVLFFERNGMQVDPMSAAGGGVVDIAALALRIACLVLRKDLQPVLILDEPCKFLSTDLQPRLRPLLSELSDRLGLQLILVTHMPTLRHGKVVELPPA